MNRLIIIGTSTTAEHVYSFVKEYNLFDIQGFAVDATYKKQDTFLGEPLFEIEDLENIMDKKNDLLFVAILWNRLNADRRDVYLRLQSQGFKFANLVSPTAKIRGKILGDNCWFHDYVIVQHDAVIGSNTLVMAYSVVGAHVELKSHCFVAAKSVIGGNCKVGEQCFLGIASIILDDRKIGNKCIVGAATVVKRDMPSFSSIKTTLDNFNVKTYLESDIENKLLFTANRH